MAHAIDRGVPQECAYCGVGSYQVMLEGDYQKTGFEQKTYHLGLNFKNVPKQNWLIMACDYCGNLQWFRADMAQKNPDAWQEGSLP